MRSCGRTMWALLLLALFASACTGAGTANPEPAATSPTTIGAAPNGRSPDVGGQCSASSASPPAADQLLGLEDLPFAQFLEDSYQTLLVRDPEMLTSLGISADLGLRNDRLNDYSDEFIRETQALEIGLLDLLRRYDRSALETSERVSYDVYEWYLDQQVRGHPFIYHEWPVHHFVNGYNYNLFLFLEEEHQLATIADAEDYVCRLGQLGRQVRQVIDGLKTRESKGILPPAVIVEWTVRRLTEDLEGYIRKEIVQADELSLYTSFASRIDSIGGMTEDRRVALLDAALLEVDQSFAPAWVELRDYLVSLRRSASEDAGVWRLPDGDAFYEFLLRQHTSTDLSPVAVHEIGLQQVDRVQTEMRRAFDALGYAATRSLIDSRAGAGVEAGFLDGTAAGGADDVIAMHDGLISEIEEAARPLFGVWPSATLEVVADEGGGGFYIPASFDGSRPGLFHAGVGDRIPMLTLPTINYHEAVPGHHTQIAVAQELNLPTFRRAIQYNAFAEGWALYAERLAFELGLYNDDPHGNIGRLELELLRAVRLVVDTGIHAFEWSRDEAHAYMNSVIPTWSYEVERYMVLPGQATGYMIGQLEILLLRSNAQEQLGDRFAMAQFHDAVLGAGSLPLAILEQVVNATLGLDV